MLNNQKHALIMLACLVIITACGNSKNISNEPLRMKGAAAELGGNRVEAYAEVNADGVPQALGVTFYNGVFDRLPEALTDGNRCYDSNGDDNIDTLSECLHWHERVLPLPTDISQREDMPFKWVLLNWNPHGHNPEGVWKTPHFDVHFYIEPIENVFALMPGPCGPELMRCDQYEIAIKPVPANFIHKDFENVGAAAPAMGNHLIDPTAPEFHGEPFTRSWLYGSFDERIIFWEEMVSLNYILTQPQECFTIKSPPEVAVSGYYPTKSCTRFNPETSDVSISVEEFIYRNSSPSIVKSTVGNESGS